MTDAYFRCAENGFSKRSMALIKEEAVNRSFIKHQQLTNNTADIKQSNEPDNIDIERYFYYLTY